MSKLVDKHRATNALLTKIGLPKQKIRFSAKIRRLGPFWVGTNFGPYHVPDIEKQSKDFLAILVKLLAIFSLEIFFNPKYAFLFIFEQV